MPEPLFALAHVVGAHLTESRDVLTPFIESVHAETHHPRPDFIVFGGDNINGDYEDPAVAPREMPLLKERLPAPAAGHEAFNRTSTGLPRNRGEASSARGHSVRPWQDAGRTSRRLLSIESVKRPPSTGGASRCSLALPPPCTYDVNLPEESRAQWRLPSM